jgi:transcription termination factor Rho
LKLNQKHRNAEIMQLTDQTHHACLIGLQIGQGCPAVLVAEGETGQTIILQEVFVHDSFDDDAVAI